MYSDKKKYEIQNGLTGQKISNARVYIRMFSFFYFVSNSYGMKYYVIFLLNRRLCLKLGGVT